jgi:membrane associated rhomboid family serine protease
MIPLKDSTPSRTVPVVVIALIVLNCLVFLLQLGTGLERSVLAFGSVPYYVTHPGVKEAVYQEVPVRYETWLGTALRMEAVEVPRPRWGPFGSLFSYMFLHGDLFHILFNMLFLWIFGNNIEGAFGHGKFVAFYFICGLAAALVQSVFTPNATTPMVGASGAVSGVMGAYFLLFPRSRILTLVPFIFFMEMIWLPAFIFLGFWFLLQFLSIGSSSNVAFLAHIGGFVAGMLLTRLFRPRRPPPPPDPEFEVISPEQEK